MKSNLLFALSMALVGFMSACTTQAKNEERASAELEAVGKIEILQFHSEHRCITCQDIEKYTLETLKAYPDISFQLLNADDKKNAEIVKKFQAYGTTLILYNPSTGKNKDITDLAFMNARNKEKFMAVLKAEIDAFRK